MRCEVLHKTPLEVLMKSTRISHMSESRMDTVGDELGPNDEKLLKRVVKLGHHSVLEHVVYSILVEDVSRALLQQMARHRHVSLTVQSTRFTLGKVMRKFSEHDLKSLVDELCVIPPLEGEDLESFYEEVKRTLEKISNMSKSGTSNDLVKYLLPECFKTRFVMTTNARELMHIIDLRIKQNAMWEFRKLSRLILDSLLEVHPKLWSILSDFKGWVL